MKPLELSTQWPIEVIDRDRLTIHYVPEHQVLQNIPVVWEMLELVVQDWSTASRSYSPGIDNKEDDRQITVAFESWQGCKPRLFQCLFSYIMFFFMLENGYQFVYSELNRVNRELELRIHHDRPPARTEFIKGLWRLRNFTVAHWAGTQKGQIAESAAGRQWGFAFGHKKRLDGQPVSFEDITPLFPGVAMASIPETHVRCTKYFYDFDQVCAGYLSSVVGQMPKVRNGIEYHGWRWTEPGLVTTRP